MSTGQTGRLKKLKCSSTIKNISPNINTEKTYDAWPFNQPFYLILNQAVGGNWGGKEGVDSTIYPQKFLIDYVRVYKIND